MYIKDEMKNRLEELIEAKKDMDPSLSVKGIALEMGIPYPSLIKYVNGTASCGLDSLVVIANYFEVSTDYLLGLSNVKTKEELKQKACDLVGFDESVLDSLSYWSKFPEEKEKKKIVEFVIKQLSSDYISSIVKYCYDKHLYSQIESHAFKYYTKQNGLKRASSIYQLAPEDRKRVDKLISVICNDLEIDTTLDYYHIERAFRSIIDLISIENLPLTELQQYINYTNQLELICSMSYQMLDSETGPKSRYHSNKLFEIDKKASDLDKEKRRKMCIDEIKKIKNN